MSFNHRNRPPISSLRLARQKTTKPDVKNQSRQKNQEKRGRTYASQCFLRSLILKSTRIEYAFLKRVSKARFFTVWIFTTIAANPHALLYSPTHFNSKIWQRGLPRIEHKIKFRTSGLTHDISELIHGHVFNLLASFLIEYSLLSTVIVESPSQIQVAGNIFILGVLLQHD